MPPSAIASSTLPVLPPGNVPVTVPGAWNVDSSIKGHTCIMVEIADWKIPVDSDGVALASDDVWVINNKAQKNVSVVLPKANSPYEPVTFNFSLNNSGPADETAFLTPIGLRRGMRLTISPPRLRIQAGQTKNFRCKLVLDRDVVDADCQLDREFRMQAWRIGEHAASKWGGVQYRVTPREGSTVDLTGQWSRNGRVRLSGQVSENPGSGKVRLWLAFEDKPQRWISTQVDDDGSFEAEVNVPSGTSGLRALAHFTGTGRYAEARSPILNLREPNPVN